MIKVINEESVVRDWARVGAMFNVAPADQTPDIEQLLLDTVRHAADNSRLIIMAASWLAHYGDYVAKRRLAVLIHNELEPKYQPIMGLLLEWAQTHSHRNLHRFREAIRRCAPAKTPEPLLDVNHHSKVLWRLAEQRASALSRRWGRWMEDFEIKDDALRPPEWIGRENPSLHIRAICGGDFVATIAADAASGCTAFHSESELARRYGASRSAVRDAVLKLKMAGYARQTWLGKANSISISTLQVSQKTNNLLRNVAQPTTEG